ncbi:hypothetical protein, partial [Brucella tritici]|uniref:hypothetical protein n=1 Tax=Brucella tritici TaxID=94626 RepID=UPI001AED91C8
INRTLIPPMPPIYSSQTSLSNSFNQLKGRTSLPLAASPPSLWRHIDPTKQICQRSFVKKQEFSFHSQYGPF